MEINDEIRNLKESISLVQLVKASMIKRQVYGLEYIKVCIEPAIAELETTLIYLEAVYEISETDEGRLVEFKEPEKKLC